MLSEPYFNTKNPISGRTIRQVNFLRYTLRFLIIPLIALLLSFSPDNSGHTPTLAAAQIQCNPITTENLLPGTDEWALSNQADDTTQQIKGYASATSVDLGDDIEFFITVSAPMTYTIDVYRMGWYEGLGGRLMQEIGPLDGDTQSTPTLDANTGLIVADWDVSHSLTVPTSWTSGIYLAKLVNADGYENYINFTVRDDNRAADFIYAQPVTTYQAYNNYPDNNSLGKSLYAHNSYGGGTVAGDARAVKVSFDRPYSRNGAGRFFNWEFPLIRWLEKSGYDVTYTTNIDTHQNGANISNFKGFLSPAHDEYWSKEMYDAVEDARDSGTNLAFLGANSLYFQARFEDSAIGEDRILVVYKDGFRDPVTDPAAKTVNWRDVNRAEQGLLGVQFLTFSGGTQDTYDYVVSSSDHWIYDGTGFVDGDIVPGIVGYEVDQYDPSYALPANTEYTILGESPFVSSASNFNGPIDVPLAPGPHVISFSLREDGSRIDKVGIVELTNVEPPTDPYPPVSLAAGLSCQSLAQDAGQNNAWFGSVEVEQGLLDGAFVVESDTSASGGAFVHMPEGGGNNWDAPNTDGVVSICFDIPTTGTYRLEAQTFAASYSANSFFVQVDSKPSFGYTWDFVANASYNYEEITTRGIVNANSSIYKAPSGAWVFTSGTMSWSWGLDTPNFGFNHIDYVDNRIQKTTENLLNGFIGGSPTNSCGVTPTVTPTATETATPINTPTNIPTPTPLDTATPLPTDTPMPIPTNTPIPTDTPTPIPTSTPIPTDTPTPIPTNTLAPTATSTHTATSTPTSTNTPTATAIAPITVIAPLQTFTPTPTSTQSVISSQTVVPTNRPQQTPSSTPTPTRIFPTPTATATRIVALPTPTSTRSGFFPTSTPTTGTSSSLNSYIYIPLIEKQFVAGQQ